MLQIIRNLLQAIIDKIDAGNSNITEEQAIEIVDVIKHYTDKEERVSKYEACIFLGISRSTFDHYVNMGVLPKGKKQQGFKELSWSKKELEYFKSNNKF